MSSRHKYGTFFSIKSYILIDVTEHLFGLRRDLVIVTVNHALQQQ